MIPSPVITNLVPQIDLGFPILMCLQLLPLVGILLLIPLKNTNAKYTTAIAIALLEIALCIVLISYFDSNTAQFQFTEKVDWLAYHAGIDGIALLFIIMTTVLSLLIIFYGRIIPLDNPGLYIKIALATEAVTIASFLQLNIFWFILFSAIQIVLLAFMLWRWATSLERDVALARFSQFMGVGLLLLLAGCIVISWNYYQYTGVWTGDLPTLLKQPINTQLQNIIFFLLFFGFIIRLPMFPFHGWFSVVAQHGVVAIAPVIFIGVKVGIYGLLRFVFPLVPEAVIQWQYFAVAFAVAGIFYAALLALMQSNLRRLLAYAVISHTGVLVLGLFSLNPLAFQGALMLSMSFGLAMSGLFFMTGLVYWRTRTVTLHKLGGLYDSIPIIGIAFLVAGLSIVGMPGTPGFDSVHLMMEATIERFGALVTVAAAIGNVIAAGFLLMAFQKAFLAPLPSNSKAKLSPATLLEIIMSVTIIVLLLFAGFYTEPWLSLIESSTEHLGQYYANDH